MRVCSSTFVALRIVHPIRRDYSAVGETGTLNGDQTASIGDRGPRFANQHHDRARL